MITPFLKKGVACGGLSFNVWWLFGDLLVKIAMPTRGQRYLSLFLNRLWNRSVLRASSDTGSSVFCRSPCTAPAKRRGSRRGAATSRAPCGPTGDCCASRARSPRTVLPSRGPGRRRAILEIRRARAAPRRSRATPCAPSSASGASSTMALMSCCGPSQATAGSASTEALGAPPCDTWERKAAPAA